MPSLSPTPSSSSGAPESWISSFCSLLGHEYFAEVSEEFIEDEFNLTGLQNQVELYKEALEVGCPLLSFSSPLIILRPFPPFLTLTLCHPI